MPPRKYKLQKATRKTLSSLVETGKKWLKDQPGYYQLKDQLKSSPKVHVSFRIDGDLARRLREVASKTGRTRSGMLETILRRNI